MTSTVNLPLTGGGDATASVTVETVTADSSHVQVVELAQVVAGALRVFAVNADGSINDDVVDRAARLLGHVTVDNFPGTEPASIADGSDVTQGAKADAAVTNPASSASVVAALKGILTDLGQTTDAAVATDANGSINAHVRGLIVALLAMSAKLPAALGQTTMAGSTSVAVASDQGEVAAKIAAGSDVTTGNTTDAAVTTNANGTVSGKLRGIVALLAGTLKTQVTPAATATLSNVPGSATSVTLLAANAARLGATIVNESTAICYVKFGSTASATSYVIALGSMGSVGSYYEVPFGYTGIITGIWASATGNARVTEITA